MFSLGSSMTLLALAAGFITNNGEKALLQVRHEGRPMTIEIIGLDENKQEVEVESLPRRFTTNPKRPRKVIVEYDPSTVKYICASQTSIQQNGASLGFRSCASVQRIVTPSSGNRRGSQVGELRSRLRQAVAAPQQLQIELQSE